MLSLMHVDAIGMSRLGFFLPVPVPVVFDPKTGGSGSGTGFFYSRQFSVVSIRGCGRPIFISFS